MDERGCTKRTGVYSFERARTAKLTKAETAELDRNAKGAALFRAQAPWYQRAAFHWVTSAKRDETRARRLCQLIAHSAKGQTIPPLTRPTAKARRAT